jgi:hypothetical protein
MNEVFGRGLYPGPHQQYRCHKTVYGNAVWQRSTPQALARTTQHRGQHDDQHRPESSGQEHQARGVDGKSLTELLGRIRNIFEANVKFLVFASNDELG